MYYLLERSCVLLSCLYLTKIDNFCQNRSLLSSSLVDCILILFGVYGNTSVSTVTEVWRKLLLHYCRSSQRRAWQCFRIESIEELCVVIKTWLHISKIVIIFQSPQPKWRVYYEKSISFPTTRHGLFHSPSNFLFSDFSFSFSPYFHFFSLCFSFIQHLSSYMTLYSSDWSGRMLQTWEQRLLSVRTTAVCLRYLPSKTDFLNLQMNKRRNERIMPKKTCHGLQAA